LFEAAQQADLKSILVFELPAEVDLKDLKEGIPYTCSLFKISKSRDVSTPMNISKEFERFFAGQIMDKDKNGDVCIGEFKALEICLKAHFSFQTRGSEISFELPLLWAGEYVLEIFEGLVDIEIASMRGDEKEVGKVDLYSEEVTALIPADSKSMRSIELSVGYTDLESVKFSKFHGLSTQANSWFSFISTAFEESRNQAGQILEFGVATGRSLSFIADLAKDHIVYGFDSFFGLPTKWGKFEEFLFNQNGIPPIEIFQHSNIELFIGWFNETLPVIDRYKPISFLHVDSDLYESAYDILDSVCCLFQENTVVVFDEFFNLQGTYQTPVDFQSIGEYRALTEVSEKYGFSYSYFPIYFEQAVAIKISLPPQNLSLCKEQHEKMQNHQETATQKTRSNTLASLKRLAKSLMLPENFYDLSDAYKILNSYR
jgi:Macrocin-O-methyltransferase (TylF)